MANQLPACGLYRTGRALPGHEEAVTSGALIYFHNHSEKGPPLVLLPHLNTNNRWTFSERGWLVEDESFTRDLISLLPEGYYVLSRHLHVSREEALAERSLVQLGYNRRGDSILFVAGFEGGGIQFPSQGYRFESPAVKEYLTVVNFRVPSPTAEQRLLH